MVKEGYKETDIGVIPEEWESVALLSKCELLNGLTYTPNDMADNGLLVIRSSNVQNNQLIFSDNVYVDLTVADEKLIKKDDIIICVRNGSAALIGKCAKASRDYPITFGAFMAVLRGENNGFIYQLLQQGTIQKHISKNSGATINQITNGDFKTIFVPFPTDLKEQERIAGALSDMDNLVSSLEKLIEKKKAIKKGAMQELLTGKKRLPGFSGTWEEKSISQYGSFVSGNGFPLKFQGNPNGKYPFYKVSDFNNRDNGRIMSKANNYIASDVADILSCNIVPKDSIIFAKIGAAIALERKKITGCDCCIDNNMMSFQPYQKEGASYICYLFQTIRFNDLVEATALPSLNGKSIGQIRKVFPPTIQEQTAIASILSDMDDEIFALEQKLAKCKKLKQGMMQQLLTGKIRLV